MLIRLVSRALFAIAFATQAAAYSPALAEIATADVDVKLAQATDGAPEPAAPPPESAEPSESALPEVPAAVAPVPLTAPDAGAATPAAPAPQPGSAAEAGSQTEQSPVPGVLRGELAMPEPVRETWRKLVEAARSGDVEQLRPILEAQPEPPSVAFDEIEDPIEYLKSLSGDAEGREILAILLEVLESGFIHVDSGTPQEMFIWPYFAQYPLETLTPQQFVELFRLLTSSDYQEMRSYGAYIFFRVGIAPDGTWRFFIAGD